MLKVYCNTVVDFIPLSIACISLSTLSSLRRGEMKNCANLCIIWEQENITCYHYDKSSIALSYSCCYSTRIQNSCKKTQHSNVTFWLAPLPLIQPVKEERKVTTDNILYILLFYQLWLLFLVQVLSKNKLTKNTSTCR